MKKNGLAHFHFNRCLVCGQMFCNECFGIEVNVCMVCKEGKNEECSPNKIFSKTQHNTVILATYCSLKTSGGAVDLEVEAKNEK